jgi:SRSO17 transposase
VFIAELTADGIRIDPATVEVVRRTLTAAALDPGLAEPGRRRSVRELLNLLDENGGAVLLRGIVGDRELNRSYRLWALLVLAKLAGGDTMTATDVVAEITGFPKDGTGSRGVARQYSGTGRWAGRGHVFGTQEPR